MSSLELLVLTSVFFSLLFSKDIPGFPDLDNPKDVRIFCILLARAVITVSQTKVVPVLVGWDGIMALGSLLSKKQGREVHVLCSWDCKSEIRVPMGWISSEIFSIYFQEKEPIGWMVKWGFGGIGQHRIMGACAQCLDVEARGLKNRHVLNSLPNKHFHRLLEMVLRAICKPTFPPEYLQNGKKGQGLNQIPSSVCHHSSECCISVAEVRSRGGGRSIVWLRSCSWNGAICWSIVSLGFRSLLCQLMLWFYVNKGNLPKPQLLTPGQAESVCCEQFPSLFHFPYPLIALPLSSLLSSPPSFLLF